MGEHRIRFTDSGVETSALNVGIDVTPDQLVPGPTPAVRGAAYRTPVSVPLRLDQPIGPRGTVALWVQTDQVYQNGCEAEEVVAPILASTCGFNITLKMTPVCTNIDAGFAESVWGIKPVLLPGLPAGQWLHLVYTWDAEEGIFEGCLNGTPIRMPDTNIDPWELSPCDTFDLTIGRFPVAEIVFSDSVLPTANISRQTPKLYQGALDALIGARERGEVELDALWGATLYERSFDSADDVADWVMEGYGVTSFEDGWMTIASSEPEDAHGHSVFWCPHDFPENVMAEWEVQPLSEYGLCIVFIAARGVNGEDIFDSALTEREGNFGLYTRGDINSYHISYYANTPFNPGRVTCNMRKNSGFYLVDNGPAGIPAFSQDVHKVAVVKQGGHIELAVNGRRIIDFTDDGIQYGPVHGSGKIGLRQMRWMTARYRNFRVSELKGI